MSAFTLGGDHIDLLVTAAMRIAEWNPKYINVPLTADTLGQDLLNENFASVNYRYSEQEEVPEYHWTPVAEIETGDLKPEHLLQVFQAAHCYDYQSCEHPAWSDSKAYWVSQAIAQWAEQGLTAIQWPKVRGYAGDSLRYAGLDQVEWVWSREDSFKPINTDSRRTDG